MHAFVRIFRTALHRSAQCPASVLTCLGIIIGIAAVISMMEIGQGSSSAIQDAIGRDGRNIVQIDPSDAVKAGASTGAGGRVNLTPDDCEAIGANAQACAMPAERRLSCQAAYGNRNWVPRISRHNAGIPPDSRLV